MQKFENVDLLDCLKKIVNLNTQHYQTDFEYDIQAIQAAANSDVAEDKHLLWVWNVH